MGCMSMGKPLIGITFFRKKDKESDLPYGRIGCNYVKSIWQAGGLPLPIPIIEDVSEAESYLEKLDGLLLSGGQDIDPVCYGEDRTDKLGKIDINRDRWEMELFKKAYSRGLPMLGICRGMQLINVALGGTLYQDLDEEYEYECEYEHYNSDNYVYHVIEVVKNTRLSEILCSHESFEVNSRHHQAIRDLAPSLRVAARSCCGLIEGVESREDRYLIGVQWHPEDLRENVPCFEMLFKSLISAAKNN